MTDHVTFRFFLFGTPKLCVNDRVIPLPPQPAALSSFLVLNRQRRITREEIQAMFWPDAEPARAQERLRRTLYLFRQAVQPNTNLLATEGNELAIAPDAALWVDYEAFEKALIDAYRQDPPDRAALQTAVDLYNDDLLKDNYADWALLEREHARQRFLTALRQLMLACQQSGDWPATIEYAHLLLHYDSLQEIAHRALMLAYSSNGDRSAAVRQYQHCVQILQDELGADPLPETTKLYEDIRQGRGIVAPLELPPAVAPIIASATDLQRVPLVGRDQEIGEIAAEWAICQGKKSRLVLVTGSAGMGKTRLVEEAVSRIPGPGVTVITGNCYAMEAGTPYQLISDLMQKAVERVVNRLNPALRADLSQLVPSLQHGIRPESAARSGVTPDVSVRLQEAVTHVIRLLASSKEGLWLVTEDLHWADPASLACLNHALRRCSDLPLMVLATLRDEEVSFDSPLMDWPTNSVHAPAPTTLIRIKPLPPDQLDRMLTALIEPGDQESLAGFLYRETAGNPFFVVETLRALIEQGVLYAESGGRWFIRQEVLPRPEDLPMSDVVLRVIRGRIRRLSRSAQEVLTLAAVIEHDIDENWLAALVDPSLSLDLALDEILQAFILAETSPGLYQFAHMKVREIIYADASAPRRRFLHRRIAELLSQQGGHSGNLADISRLAYHYAQGREWTSALLHAWRASQTAQFAGAMAEANRYAESAQTILDDHLAEIDLSLLPVTLAAVRFDLLSLRAEFRRQAATGGLYYPLDMITAIETLMPDIDKSRQARASLQRATHLLGRGDLDGAKEAAQRGRELYARLDDLWGELDALQHQLDIAYRAGDMRTMRDRLEDMRTISRAVDPGDIRQVLAYNEMRLAVYDHDWIAVLHLAQELSSSLQVHFDPAIAWLSLANLGLAYLKLGAYDEAFTAAKRAVEASEDAGVLGLGARVLLAKLELWRGNVEQAQEILLSLLEKPDPLIGEVEVVSPALTLVRCCVALGDDQGAERWAKRAAQAMSRVRLPILFPLSQVAWALVNLVVEHYDKASKRLIYPLEYMLLLEDISPQELFVLRAAAARGLGDQAAADYWLNEASRVLQDQAAGITDPLYRASFLNNVPLHRFITEIAAGRDWHPLDVLTLQNRAAAT